MRWTTRSRAGIPSRGALFVLLAACSFSWASSSSGRSSAWSASAAGSTSGGNSWSFLGGVGRSATVSVASRSGGSCTVTLAGEGARVHVLGTSIAFRGVRNGRATVRVGARNVTLVQGETVSVDGLSLRCTRVSDDRVSLDGSLV